MRRFYLILIYENAWNLPPRAPAPATPAAAPAAPAPAAPDVAAPAAAVWAPPFGYELAGANL